MFGSVHDGDVLGCLMRHTQRPIGQAAADDHDLDVGVVIADVVADLLQAAERGKVGDAVRDRDVAFHRHATGHTGHVLLGHAAVVPAIREGVAERLDFAVTDIRQDHPDPLVALRDVDQHSIEQGSHEAAPTSFKA